MPHIWHLFSSSQLLVNSVFCPKQEASFRHSLLLNLFIFQLYSTTGNDLAYLTYFDIKLYVFILYIGQNTNKPGTAQVGAISKAQKQQKDFKVSKYSLLRYRKNPKVEPNWRTRGDTLRVFIHSVANQKRIEGGALLVKKKFLKKVSQCRKN